MIHCKTCGHLELAHTIVGTCNALEKRDGIQVQCGCKGFLCDDLINHPSHYNFGGIEVIDAIEAWRLPFHEANVVKYIARAKHKGRELEDLKKAAWYLARRIRQLEPSQEEAE